MQSSVAAAAGGGSWSNPIGATGPRPLAASGAALGQVTPPTYQIPVRTGGKAHRRTSEPQATPPTYQVQTGPGEGAPHARQTHLQTQRAGGSPQLWATSPPPNPKGRGQAATQGETPTSQAVHGRRGPHVYTLPTKPRRAGGSTTLVRYAHT